MLFGKTFGLLEKVLDFRSVRHNIIASNIANSQTPNYKAVGLAFEGQLEKAMEADSSQSLSVTNPKHFPINSSGQGGIEPDLLYSQASGGNDSNNVNLDAEMAKLSENNLMYDAMAQILKIKFDGLKELIREGGR